jgi:membrane protein YdbS with pleckstrin-like domain
MAAASPDPPGVPSPASSLPSPGSSSRDGPTKEDARRSRAAATDEVDIWWGSYASRTMLPSFLLCLLLTIVLLAIDWYLEGRNERSDLISSAVLGTAVALWLFEGTRWFYRMIAINYRLTSRRLLCTRGFSLRDCRAVDLAQVTEVAVESSPIERLLGVGRILIHVQDGHPAAVLDGVLKPRRVARTIRRRVRHARA